MSVLDFCFWQHIGSNRSATHIQKLANLLEIPIKQLYSHLIGQSKHILQFEMNRSPEKEGPSLIGKFLTYPGTTWEFFLQYLLHAWTSTALRNFGAGLPHQDANPIP